MGIFVMIKSLLALIIVIGLVFIFLKFIQKLGFSNKYSFLKTGTNQDIEINSVAYLDNNSKIVTFTSGGKKYIILLGKNNDLLVDSYEVK